MGMGAVEGGQKSDMIQFLSRILQGGSGAGPIQPGAGGAGPQPDVPPGYGYGAMPNEGDIDHGYGGPLGPIQPGAGGAGPQPGDIIGGTGDGPIPQPKKNRLGDIIGGTGDGPILSRGKKRKKPPGYGYAAMPNEDDESSPKGMISEGIEERGGRRRAGKKRRGR